jgi:hypothetical protein
VTPTAQDANEQAAELFFDIETELQQDLEMAVEPITTDVDLTPEDARALRQKINQMLFAFITWERKATILSDLVMIEVGKGNGDRVIQEILRQSPIRAENNRALREAATMDFRLMLLTSPGMAGKDLEHWLPEYAGRWREVPHSEEGKGEVADSRSSG